MTEVRDGWSERFERFAARKASLAKAALLPPYLTEFEKPAGDAIAIGNAWSTRLFDGPFYMSPAAAAERPACSLVFVQSLDGNTGTRNPGLLGGGDTDKHVIYEGLSRVAADAVLAGAETVRGSEIVLSVWHPELVGLRRALHLPRHPVQIVASIRGLPLDEALLFNVPDIRVVLITTPSAARQMQHAIEARPWLAPVLIEAPEQLPGAFARLRPMGIARVSCIGGRTLAASLLNARLVDDVYLTTGVNRAGDPGTPLSLGAWRGAVVVRKRGTGIEQGVTFEHLRPSAALT